MSRSGLTASGVALLTGRLPRSSLGQLLCDWQLSGLHTRMRSTSAVRSGFGTVMIAPAEKPHRQDSTGSCPLRLVSRSIHSSSTQYDRKDFVPSSLMFYCSWVPPWRFLTGDRRRTGYQSELVSRRSRPTLVSCWCVAESCAPVGKSVMAGDIL